MSLMDWLGGHLDRETMAQLSRQLGADPATTQGAVGAARPVLLGAMGSQLLGRFVSGSRG